MHWDVCIVRGMTRSAWIGDIICLLPLLSLGLITYHLAYLIGNMYDPRLPVTSVTVSTHALPLPHFF